MNLPPLSFPWSLAPMGVVQQLERPPAALPAARRVPNSAPSSEGSSGASPGRKALPSAMNSAIRQLVKYGWSGHLLAPADFQTLHLDPVQVQDSTNSMSNLTVTRISFALALSLLILLAIQGSSVLDTQAFERKFLLYPILVIVSVVILMRLRGSRFSLESERQFSFALSDAIGLQIIPTGCFLYSVVVVNHTHS
ncbi:MAG: hypothetical protein PVJ40_06210, partial [Gammaproteobacteria bacterium]